MFVVLRTRELICFFEHGIHGIHGRAPVRCLDFRTRISRISRICAHMFAMFKGVALYATNIRGISGICG